MSRINTNVQSLIAQRVLGQNNRSLGVSLERLSTGLRINRGADDPAGLIASENLRAEQTALAQAIDNAERAEQVANIAEGGLQEIASLLNELEGLVTATANTAGLSEAEKDANQLQIDSVLQTIDRIANATSFQGTRLLNGNFDYSTNNVNTDVSTFKVNGAKPGFGQSINVDVVVTNSAQVGGFFLSFAGANIDLGASTDRFVFEVAGSIGAREFSFASGASLASIAAAVNTFTDVTGVTATVSGTGVRLDSSEFGSEEFVSVKVSDTGSIAGTGIGIFDYASFDTGVASAATITTFASAANAVKDLGQDVTATINGIVATGQGTRASINTDFLSVEIDLSAGAAGGTANSQTLGALQAFTIDGGGADFQLASQVDIAGKVSIGIQNVASRTIGNTTDNSGTQFSLADLANGNSLNIVDGDLVTAQKAIRAAVQEVSSLRGRIGAFQKNTIGATIRSLGVSFENTTAAESSIRDTDFAEQTAELTRSQILVSASTNTLAVANTQPQSVLSLLG
ncbi:MAG: flagellin N-terminal helical domain-containing protein [Planctomycetota bacterium]|jgi:flagellin